MFQSLIDKVVDFHDDIFRNIATVSPSENLFDDLSSDEDAWVTAAEAVDTAKEADSMHSLIIQRPFQYGKSVEGSRPSRHATRFSTGNSYGVLYGSLDIETTIRETIFHWVKWLRASESFSQVKEFIAQRRVYRIAVGGVLVDLRGKEGEFPELLNPDSYRFTHQVGEYLHAQRQNGLLVRSARCLGTNAAIFNPEVLSNVRTSKYLQYCLDMASGEVVARAGTGPTGEVLMRQAM